MRSSLIYERIARAENELKLLRAIADLLRLSSRPAFRETFAHAPYTDLDSNQLWLQCSLGSIVDVEGVQQDLMVHPEGWLTYVIPSDFIVGNYCRVFVFSRIPDDGLKELTELVTSMCHQLK